MFARLRSLARMLTGRNRFEREMRDEVGFHIESRAEDLMRSGLTRDEAMRQARMEFGAVDAIKDDCREARGVRWFDEIGNDIRYAFRLMAKTPGFTTAAVLSLALGIGANTAIFSLMDAVLLRTLPIRDPQSLVYFAHGLDEQNSGISSNYPMYERFKALDTTMFDGITAYSSTGFTVQMSEGLDMVSGLWASGNYHAVLGVPMALGRGFSAEDDRAKGNAPIAVISDAFWARRFGRDPDILDRTLNIDGRSVAIVGVTAPEFTGPIPGLNPDLTIPISVRTLSESGFLDDHGTYTNWSIVGRLRPDVPRASAYAAVDTVFQQFMSEPENVWIRKNAPDGYAKAQLPPAAKGRGPLRRQYETALQVLMAMVAIVLLIASVNVANLLLVRASARAKEVAIRLCVGGGRARLIRQFLTESLILAALGGVLGSVFAIWGTSAIIGLLSVTEAPPLIDVSPNLRVLAFTLAVTTLTGFAFGIWPALKSTKIDLTPALKEAAVVIGRTRGRWSSAHLLVGTQVALGVLVLAVAALLVRSLVNLRSLDTGFTPGNLLMVTLETWGTPIEPERRLEVFGDAVDRIRSLPGVRAVSASRSTPVHTSGNARALVLPDNTATRIEDQAAFTNMVTPEYFDTMGIHLRKGRLFTDQDRDGAPHVAVVNESMAKFWAGDRDPLGVTVSFRGDPKDLITIVGVVEDTYQMNLREAPPRTVYTPLAQLDKMSSLIQIEIRTVGDPALLAASARSAIRAASSDVVIRYLRTMDEQIDASLVRERLLAALSSSFAMLAVVLCAIGLYGVMSYSVTRRSREIGIRMALGAGRGRVLGQIMMQTVIIAIAGSMVGVIAALMTARQLSTFMFQLSERDPMTLVIVASALVAISIVAGLLPARRAATLDPVRAIKAE